MKITFLRDCKYEQNDKRNSREYKAGETYELPTDHAHRWLRRNAAVEFVEEAKPVKARPAEKLVPPKGETV